MKKKFTPSNEQLEKISFFVLPLLTIVLCLMSGLWWLSNDLPRGVVCFIVLTVFVVDYGAKAFKHRTSRQYYFWVFLLPWFIAALSFTYGFF
jgi:hypothetical protein